MFSTWFGAASGPADDSPRLVSLDDKATLPTISLEELPLLIGRSAVADVQLKDIRINDFHCVLEGNAEQLQVRDLGTRQGTFVNGARVAHATLMPGDTLTLGETRFQFCGAGVSARPKSR